MAKSFTMAKDKKSGYPYPSRFGSHNIMVDAEASAKLEDQTKVVLNDEHGSYVTERNRLDTGVADPNRFETSRLDKLFSRTDKK